MSWRFLAFLLVAASLFGAAKKTVAEAKGENLDLALTVTLYIDPASVKGLLGADLDHFIVAAQPDRRPWRFCPRAPFEPQFG